MNKNLQFFSGIKKKSVVILTLAIISLLSSNVRSAPGDTTWVTTFNQNFQNWADVHYGNFTLPDTNTHYKQILMYYTIGCPPAGCDPWDRLGWIRLYQDSVINYEIARVITPYNIVGSGYPGQCVFVFDVTDYMPLLHGDVRLASYIESWIGGTRGWLVTVKFGFIEGEIANKPFKVINLWQNNHIIYGDPSLPPSDYLTPQTVFIDPQTTHAKVRINNTGHGQGNTDNAAEFSFKIHTLTVGSDATAHALWRGDCDVNPCSPQGGTWQYGRAGWCPGASVIPFEVDATGSVTPNQNVVVKYDLMPFENFCRPNNPLCVSGVTCSDCNFNNNGHTEPHYTVQGQMILYKPNPFSSVTSLGNEVPASYALEQNYPNPFNPSTKIRFSIPESSEVNIAVYDVTGKFVQTLVNGGLTAGVYETEWNAGNNPSGIYFCNITTAKFTQSVRMVLVK